MARAWGATVPERQRQQAAWAFIKAAIDEYIELSAKKLGRSLNVTPPSIALTFTLDKAVIELARLVGQEASELSIEQACFQLSATYTALVPSGTRSELGMYYTPPALTQRLLDMAEEAGIDWQTAHVLDPACGGGAFLLPVALRMREAMKHGLRADDLLNNIMSRLRGFEIDPFAAWLTQTWLEIAFADCLVGKRLPPVVQVRDTLEQEPSDTFFDLVIGNPPYGRMTLTASQRERFKRSLYGHANLYGVFTDIALRWAKPNGLIAYVTPTSFLAGEYFKSLRSLLAREAPPVAIDFIAARRGVFEDVLQEALLATYRKGGIGNWTPIHYLGVTSDISAGITHAGRFIVPPAAEKPWVVPRIPEHQTLVDRLAAMSSRLGDWGYQVSTGPLVWNRFKPQLRPKAGRDIFPLVWAEAVAWPNRFVHRAEKRSHQPYFYAREKDAWLKMSVPCVLLQRTTAKEQPRRLIAAEMPLSFIKKHGAVIVENHLNMIKPIAGQKPKVSTAALSALMNSGIADAAFRCISGSVAVSAFELEALPLPSPDAMAEVEKLIEKRADTKTIESFLRALYLGGSDDAS
ncbi:MAG TPA: N-6 DNA methylase [Bradyrhizobium sp.]|nr:N-6 DNA methylase [Bradyrhizobium sp.]